MLEKEAERPQPHAYELEDAGWVLGRCSVNHVRNLIRQGLLERVYIGRRACVTRKSIEQLIESGGTGKPEDDRQRAEKGRFMKSAEAS